MSVLVYAVNMFFEVIIFLIVAQAVMSWFVRPHDRFYRVYAGIGRIVEPILYPFRMLMSRFTGNMMIDISPIIAIFALGIIRKLIITVMFMIM